jgi:hypothetical protein
MPHTEDRCLQARRAVVEPVLREVQPLLSEGQQTDPRSFVLRGTGAFKHSAAAVLEVFNDSQMKK